MAVKQTLFLLAVESEIITLNSVYFNQCQRGYVSRLIWKCLQCMLLNWHLDAGNHTGFCYITIASVCAYDVFLSICEGLNASASVCLITIDLEKACVTELTNV